MKLKIFIIPFFIILFCLATACNKYKYSFDIPGCIQNKINTFKAEPKGNPPKSITEYNYQSKRVFYVPPQCCDQYSDLFDENCNLLGHPDGGITGKGDGRFPNFFTEAKDAKVIWKDDR